MRQPLRRDRESMLTPNRTMPRSRADQAGGTATDVTGRGDRVDDGRRAGVGLPLPPGVAIFLLRPLGTRALSGGPVRTPTGRRSLPSASWRPARLGGSSVVVGLRFVG